MARLFFILLLGLLPVGLAYGQTGFTLFTDCNCDHNYLTQQLPYLSHTRVATGADVRLLIAEGGTGGGGRRYDLTFTGLKDFEGLEEKVSFEIEPNSSDDAERRQLVATVKKGLLPFLLASDLADRIEYVVDVDDTSAEVTQPPNNWNNWVFSVYAEGSLESESAQQQLDGEFGLEADRVTEDTRIRLDAETEYSERQIERDQETFLRIRRQWFAAGSVVFSLGRHWALGGFTGYNSSTYGNYDHSYWISPAIEYNIYPYSEVLRREITLAYRIGYRYNDYIETTIFGQDTEHLFNTSLNVQARFRQPWGNINARFDALAYLHDFSKNRLELDSYVDLNLYRGLALRVSIDLSLVRDQLNLPAGETSLEDLILRQRQIATDFRAQVGIGVSYTFGYLSNNIINYRL